MRDETCEEEGQALGTQPFTRRHSPKPITHERRMKIMALASEVVAQMAAKIENHEQRFFLQQLDAMIGAEQLGR